MRRDPTLEQIAELMEEMEAYHHRIVVIKIGGNAIAEDEHFLAKIARQVKFLRQNGVRVVLIHGGGPQIDDALRDRRIVSRKGPDGRRITSPAAMKVVHRVMNEVNRQVVAALEAAGIKKDKIVSAAGSKQPFVQAEPLDATDGGLHNRSGQPTLVAAAALRRHLELAKVIVLHSVGIGADRKTIYNINGDDYAMAVAIQLHAKRLLLVTNVSGVLDKQRQRIPAIDHDMAAALMAEGTITGGMVPKVESALWVVKHHHRRHGAEGGKRLMGGELLLQGVGGVAIIDGFNPWCILAELLTHEGFGTLFVARVG